MSASSPEAIVTTPPAGTDQVPAPADAPPDLGVEQAVEELQTDLATGALLQRAAHEDLTAAERALGDIGPESQLTETEIPIEREAVLRKLLDGPDEGNHVNYESAVRLGLINLFDYDPKTGRDALVHILSGELIEGADGAEVPEGFHHEPSGAFGPFQPDSSVDREHLSELKARQRANYKERPYEPYQAKVRVGGYRRFVPQVDPETGITTTKEARNIMYPKEYDSLTIMQAVRMALQNREQAEDIVADNGKLVGEGFAPMIDGVSLMKLRLIMDPITQKVITAYPLAKFRGIMKLSEEAVARFERGEDI